jgi:hypothetical protein
MHLWWQNIFKSMFTRYDCFVKISHALAKIAYARGRHCA